MTPERWQEVKKVLAAALEQPPAERSVYLDQACTDPGLRREVDSLIAAHEQGDTGFMEQPAIEKGALKSGSKLGPYTILGHLGAGGMGEVYRAHDAKLERDVAIKVLPLVFVNDPERLARFQREARMLASLNHPNIASIHGLEDSGNVHALVMELVEGPTLADRIKAGPIPIDEALPVAKQMCDALEYAHEHGIVHRDLKPANIKVTADDSVKILDFGLAKALAGDAGSADMANSPTISQLATEAGVLLGTVAYMSPEQAKAKPVDRRADIWAFGCVLYEMLTGQRAFHGETVTDTLAAVLKNDPDWTQLPGERRCGFAFCCSVVCGKTRSSDCKLLATPASRSKKFSPARQRVPHRSSLVRARPNDGGCGLALRPCACSSPSQGGWRFCICAPSLPWARPCALKFLYPRN